VTHEGSRCEALLVFRLILVALATTALASCANVHCSTEGNGGGPGGCGFDWKFSTSDSVAPPGSPENPETRSLPQP
jgi:hypothetical protein